MLFLADGSCDFVIVRALRAAGYDVKAVSDIAPGVPDEEVINLAVRESRALLTEDKDFGQLVYASAAESPGVMLIRFPANTRKNIATIVVEFIERNTEKIKGHFIVVQPGRIRISE